MFQDIDRSKISSARPDKMTYVRSVYEFDTKISTWALRTLVLLVYHDSKYQITAPGLAYSCTVRFPLKELFACLEKTGYYHPL